MSRENSLFPDRTIHQGKGELVKASAAIQISQKVTTVERKVWNVLLQNAYPELPKDDTHSIPARTVLDRIGQSTNNYEYLRDRLRSLVSTQVEWNLLSKDTNRWGVAALLADAEIVNGMVHYSFGGQLKKKLHSPSVFASFQLSLQTEFSCKYTLPLYEVLIDYSFQDGWCRVPQMTIEQCKRLLGVEGYDRWTDFRRYVLEKAIDEIHEKTDLRVEYEPIRAGRTRAYTDIHIRAVRQRKLPSRAGEVENYLRSIDATRRKDLIEEAASRLDSFNRRTWNEKGKEALGTWELVKEHILDILEEGLDDEGDA